MTWIAYADESMRQRRDGSGLYAIAAVVFELADVDELRTAAAGLAHGRLPFHWREAGPQFRSRAMDVVASLDALHYVVVGVGLDNRRQERHRRKCLQRLLWELEQFGVEDVVLDSRRPRQDGRDLLAVVAWRSQHVIGSDLRIDFARASAEPLIWLADVVAGVATAAWGDGDEQYVKRLKPQLEQIAIELD